MDTLQISQPFSGMIVLIRRRSRQSECAHLLQLLGRTGESGQAIQPLFLWNQPFQRQESDLNMPSLKPPHLLL